MKIGAAKICLSNPEKTKSYIRCQHFFPSSHQRKVLGELIFLTEIRFNAEPNTKLITLADEVFEIIVNGLRTNYYTPESLKNDGIEENFESALQKLNRLIYQESISSKSFETLIKNLNAAVGLILDEKIYFSSVGSTQIFILKKNKIVDLVSEEINSTPARVFSQIISGNLEKDDALFFSTANFLDYFVFEKLNSIINKFSTEEASKKLIESLKNLKDKISVGAILLKKEKNEITEIEDTKDEVDFPQPVVRKETVEKIITKEKDQPKISPIKPLKIKVETEKEDNKELRIVQEKTLPLIKTTRPKPMPDSLKEKSVSKNKFIRLPKISFAFIKKVRLPQFKFTPPTMKLNQFKILPLIVIIILVGALIYTAILYKNQEKNTVKFFLALQRVQAKNAMLNASITYGDAKKTTSLVGELKAMINAVNASNPIEKELVDNLKNEFLANTDKIYGVTRIENPIIFADLSKMSQKQGLKKIINFNNNLIILNQTTNEIFKYDQQKKISTLVKKINYPINKIIAYSNQEVLIIGEKQVQLLNFQSQQLTSLPIETLRKNFVIDDADFFDNKLYVLDTQANQIYKYLKTNNVFNKEIAWLNEKVDLKNSGSLSVDGSIYLLNSSNQVQKFFMGKTQKITLADPYPSIIKPTKIFINADLNNLYILEPSQKRILVYNKDGKLKKQIISEKFDDLRDIFVDQKEANIFILNQDQIIQVGL